MRETKQEDSRRARQEWCRPAGVRWWRSGGAISGTLLAALLFQSSCSPDQPLPEALLESAQGIPCGDDTYQNFAADFFAKYCLRCHNQELVGDVARTDAPNGINFNTLSGVRGFQARIRLRAAVQGDMPPLLAPVPRPSEDERRRLLKWIDCGSPAGPQDGTVGG